MESAAAEKKKALKIDPAWEFQAPKYYDFVAGETEEEKVEAEKWLDAETSYDASPHVGKSKTVAELLHLNPSDEDMDEVVDATSPHENKENQQQQPDMSNAMQTPVKNISEALRNEAGGSAPRKTLEERVIQKFDEQSSASQQDASAEADVSPNTPNPNEDAGVRHPERTPFSVVPSSSTAPPGSLPAKRLHSHGWKEDYTSGSLTMPKLQKPSSARQFLNGMKKKDPHCRLRSMMSPDNNPPAHKKQKLDEGRLRQIKERIFRPKEHNGLTVPQEFQFCTEKRSRVFGGAECSTTFQGGRPPSPFVSLAEKVRRFQMKTPERFHANTGGSQELDDHRKLKLTKPKTPEFETSHRIRQIKVKSTAELEEEMLAKIPKFKARPAPKKILEPQPPPSVQKPVPPAPEFHEFHLRTNERALQHKCAERDAGGQQQGTSSVATSMDSVGAEMKRRRKSAPGGDIFQIEPPHLLTATRARPITVKSREELEMEEIAKMPKFKARPLNKRIFESRGDLGIYRNNKREVTQIEEFHFATDQRLKHHEQPSSLADVFSKMCLSQQQQAINLRPTVPEPFHLETENRGVLKEMKFMQEVLQREQEEIQKRVPRAHPLPFTTDVPAIPPKPEPKEATRPEPFQLESVIRHMDEQQRLAEERKRAEEMEAALKAFRAQPNLSNAPVFMPFRSRKPLTEVQEFQFHLDSRATERAEFDRMLQEKQNQYKRFREECEAVRKAEEEKIIKALRKEMVPHARPMPVFGRPFVPQRSSKEPTRPVAPALLTETLTRRPSSQRRRSSMTSTAQMRRRMGQMR